MRQQRIEEEAVADAAEQEYQVFACCCKREVQYLSPAQATCRLTAWCTGYWVVMAAGKEGKVGQGGRGAYSKTQGQEAKEKGI